MKIKFINHSSIIIDTGSEKILCDPWYTGTAFANGWRLLLDDYTDINKLKFDKLWISHEHPDHFSIPTLKSLKEKKPVLYQSTKDKKVKKYLEAQGHDVFELPQNIKQNIAGCKITSIVTEGYDSCILVDNGKVKFLNVNDSQLDKKEEIKKVIQHTPIDLISIQFHYANWAGNPGDEVIPELKRTNAVNRIKKICEVCGTNDVILFASFVYYAHEENFYWNKPFSHITKTITELKEAGINPILMVPNQEIDLNQKEFKKISDNNNIAIDYWKSHYQKIKIKEFSKKYDINFIKDLYFKFLTNLSNKNNLEQFNKTFLNDFRLLIKVTDLNLILSIGIFEKSFETFEVSSKDGHDVALSSEALSMLFQNQFALGSITISSRIQFNYQTAYKFYFFFLIPYRNNIGTYLEKSITLDLNFEAFKTNGVLKPIFNINKEAEINFNKFNDLLRNL